MAKLKSKADIDKMRAAGQLAAKTLRLAGSLVKPGISTEEIDAQVHAFITQNNAIAAPLGYKNAAARFPFPKSICTSINDVICHGIPSPTAILKPGDIINIDVTVILNGFHGDCSRTFYVGDEKLVPARARLVTEISHDSLARAIAVVRHGCRLGDIGAAIQTYAESQGCSVVRDFVGHGIGTIFHERELQVPHFGRAGVGLKMARGMTFTIEPMINGGDWRSVMLDDGWTAKTPDGQPSAQFEHTLAIVGDGVEILTALEDDSIALLAKQYGANIVWPQLAG